MTIRLTVSQQVKSPIKMVIFDVMQEIKAYVTILSKPTIIGKIF